VRCDVFDTDSVIVPLNSAVCADTAPATPEKSNVKMR